MRRPRASAAAEPQTRHAWESVKEGAGQTGHSLKNFFTRLFGD